MKNRFSFLIVLLLLLSSSLLRASEPAIFSILAWKEGDIVWLEREVDGVDLSLTAVLEAQLADLHDEEKALGLEPLFPRETTLESIFASGSGATAVLRSPSLPWLEEGNATRDEVSYLAGQWSERLSGIDAITLHLEQNGEEPVVIDGVHRPILSKSEPPAPEADARSIQPMSVPHAAAQGTAQPVGALSDASIFLNPGHGWHYVSNLGRWATQRGNVHQHIEDLGTAESVLQYLHQYLWNAGARIYTARERDLNTNMVIVTAGGAGYSQTGSWSHEAAGGAYNGSQRYATTVTGEPTATARFTPNIPEAGHYAVYVWYRYSGGGTTTEDARISINHTGDSTLWVQNQNRDGFTWKYIGTYYFDEGSNPATGSVVIDNKSTVGGRRVIAGAVRFGGGMGDVPDEVSGTISGKPRWEESGRYYAGFLGKSDWASSDQVWAMPRWAAWEHESWEAGKSVYLSWHSNAGGGTGTETFSHTNPYPGSVQLRNRVHDQVVRDIKAAWNPSWADRGRKTASFGELSTANNPVMPAALIEVGFHDHVNDTKHLLDPEFRRQVARAVYKGLVQYYANEVPGFNNATYLPEPPRNFRVTTNADGTITLNWDAPQFSTGSTGLYGHAATGYRVYRSKNGKGFDNGVAVRRGTTATIGDVAPGEVVYFRVSATNAGGESFPTATLAARPVDQPRGEILIVNGFNRNDRFMNVLETDPHSANLLQRGYANRLNTYDYVIQHAQAIAAYPEAIRIASAEAAAVENGVVSLSDYDAVVWMAGLQADVNDIGTRATPAFSGSLYTRLNQYRNAGGQLFISGAEVAADLNRAGQNSWLNQVLKAEFVADALSVEAVQGLSDSMMTGWSGAFDGGSGLLYSAAFSDVIAPAEGATSLIKYIETTGALFEGFETISGWWQPGQSGSTSVDARPNSTWSRVSSPVHNGNGAAKLHYDWGATGTFIRVHRPSFPQLSADSNLSVWVYGDNSGHRVRFSVHDSDGELLASPYTTINFTGWREIVWENIRNNASVWAGTGDGAVTGPNVGFESIQLSKASGGPGSGDIYFDYMFVTPVATGDENVHTAAIQYDGDHRVVYLGFPFESITSEVQRTDLMGRALDFFGFSLTPFESWQKDYFTEAELDDPEISGDLADPSGDGIQNILKYALDLDPRESGRAGLPRVSVEEGFLTFRYRQAKNATDIDYLVQVSDDLVAWESGEGQVEIIDTVDEGEVWEVIIRDNQPFPANGRRFIRLQVTRQ